MGVTGIRLDLWSTQEVYWFSCMTCITKIFQPTASPLIIPYHAIPDITVPTVTGDKLMPTQGRGFHGFLPVCMQGTWGWFSSQVNPFPTAWESTTCTHAYDHITWNNKSFEMRWCYKGINDHTKILCRGSECLPSMCGEAGCNPKLLKVFFSLQKSYLRKFEINTYFQNSTKKLLGKFWNKYENKLDEIWER